MDNGYAISRAINENDTELLNKYYERGYRVTIFVIFPYSWNEEILNQKHIDMLLWFISKYGKQLIDIKCHRYDIKIFLNMYYVYGVNINILKCIMYMFINYDYRLATNFYKNSKRYKPSFIKKFINNCKHYILSYFE